MTDLVLSQVKEKVGILRHLLCTYLSFSRHFDDDSKRSAFKGSMPEC